MHRTVQPAVLPDDSRVRAGLFNPQSFLTAVMQTTARKNDWPLDKTVIVTEVTKRAPEQVEGPSRDGAFVHGLSLEGARWDEKAGALAESKHKELSSKLPVRTPLCAGVHLRDVFLQCTGKFDSCLQGPLVCPCICTITGARPS